MTSPSFTARFRHYVNLSKNERKLGELLRRFRFAGISDALRELASLTEQPFVPHDATQKLTCGFPSPRQAVFPTLTGGFHDQQVFRGD
jgi:hypothetical protein